MLKKNNIEYIWFKLYRFFLYETRLLNVDEIKFYYKLLIFLFKEELKQYKIGGNKDRFILLCNLLSILTYCDDKSVLYSKSRVVIFDKEVYKNMYIKLKKAYDDVKLNDTSNKNLLVINKFTYDLLSLYKAMFQQYNLVYLRLRITKNNMFVNITAGHNAKVLGVISGGMFFKKTRFRKSRHSFEVLGEKVGNWLKLRNIKNTFLIFRERLGSVPFVNGLKKNTRIIGRVYLYRYKVGFRRLKMYGRRKNTRRFR